MINLPAAESPGAVFQSDPVFPAKSTNSRLSSSTQKSLRAHELLWLHLALPCCGLVTGWPLSERNARLNPVWKISVPMRRRIHVLYSGHVQGVGFRYTVKSVVTGYEVTGAVRNLPDGRVELVAEGTPDELEAFKLAIRESGVGRLIAREEVSWSEATSEFRGFAIDG